MNKKGAPITECEKLDAGYEYDFRNDDVNARKASAVVTKDVPDNWVVGRQNKTIGNHSAAWASPEALPQ